MGAPGIEELKWLKPVRPGDTLRARRTVLETKASRSRPEMGLVRFHYELLNQNGDVVLSQRNWSMLGRRDAETRPSAEPERGPASAADATFAPAAAPDEVEPASFFEDVPVGETVVLGSYAFTADKIIAFARRYDPQPFHVDPEAARDSFYGGLIASGWHTGSAWMSRLVERRTRQREAALARGERPVNFGPSPGFRDLKWLKPVHAGDTLTFRTTVVDKRVSASRPDWGLVLSQRHRPQPGGRARLRIQRRRVRRAERPVITSPAREERRAEPRPEQPERGGDQPRSALQVTARTPP